MEEFLKPMGLSQTALARAIGVPPRRINEIVLGKRAVTADSDLRLARYFGLSEGFFDHRGEDNASRYGVQGAGVCLLSFV
jgi:addiction module HigA family antidote